MAETLAEQCPFCAGAGHVIASDPYYPRFVKTWRPQCQKCGANLGEFDTPADAITAWNTRVPALRSGENDGWMDIATAPRDRDILLWHPGSKYEKPGPRIGQMTWMVVMPVPVIGCTIYGPEAATHWRPLPPSPAAIGE